MMGINSIRATLELAEFDGFMEACAKTTEAWPDVVLMSDGVFDTAQSGPGYIPGDVREIYRWTEPCGPKGVGHAAREEWEAEEQVTDQEWEVYSGDAVMDYLFHWRLDFADKFEDGILEAIEWVNALEEEVC